MKKAVIFIIVTVFVASVVLISAIGMSIDTYNEWIKVTSIEPQDTPGADIVYTQELDGSQTKTFILEWDYDRGEARYLFVFKILPNEATNKNLDFVISDNNKDNIKRDGNAVTILKKGYYTIVVTSTDGSEVYTRLAILTGV